MTRAQKTKIGKLGSKTSDRSFVNGGVPQGSVLEPLLFLLYINDLTKIEIRGTFTLFADDATILWHDKDHENLKQIIEHDLVKVNEWCGANSLRFNISKTSVLSFKFDCDPLTLDNNFIENSTVTKFLGILIDNKLKFSEHVKTLSKKLAAGCYAVRIVTKELDLSIARSVYFSLIESHLRNGTPFWGFCNQQLLNSLLILQKRAVRYLFGVRLKDHCKPLFIRGKILTIIGIFILRQLD